MARARMGAHTPSFPVGPRLLSVEPLGGDRRYDIDNSRPFFFVSSVRLVSERVFF